MVVGRVGKRKVPVIVFRVDASLQAGIGHVMRCLTLAKTLHEAGVECQFICRSHPGNMIDFIRTEGFEVVSLQMTETHSQTMESETNGLTHSDWLGEKWETDASQTLAAIGEAVFDWLIVDHYALDVHWERAVRPRFKKILVIDDLADRPHDCEVLLDQNMVNRLNERYQDKLPVGCISLLGPQYAILRPEFGQLRPASLSRRAIPKLERLLVFLGGSDIDNETGKVVEGVRLSKKDWQHIDVVVGKSFPELVELKKKLVELPSARLHIQTSEMAKLMCDADLAITAGGSVTWEKCALGLPSLVVTEGENQYPIATKMHQIGAQRTLGMANELSPDRYAHVIDAIQLDDLTAMTKSAQSICDGSGIAAVLHAMGIAT